MLVHLNEKAIVKYPTTVLLRQYPATMSTEGTERYNQRHGTVQPALRCTTQPPGKSLN